MTLFTTIGLAISTIALIFYTLGFLNERYKKFVSNRLLILMGMGLFSDIVSNAFIIMDSTVPLLSAVNILGILAISGMVAENYLLYDYRRKRGLNRVPKRLHLNSRIIYFSWLAIFCVHTTLLFY